MPLVQPFIARSRSEWFIRTACLDGSGSRQRCLLGLATGTLFYYKTKVKLIGAIHNAEARHYHHTNVIRGKMSNWPNLTAAIVRVCLCMCVC